MSKQDDELVWGLTGGSRLRCVKDLVMEGSGEVAFKEGAVYSIDSMHPIHNPPFVRLMNDQHQTHRLEPDDLRTYFERV